MSQVPQNPHEITRLNVQYPFLSNNSPDRCPVPMSRIMAYLAVEAVDGENLTEEDLEFVRTAKVDGVSVWLWRFFEPDGEECYVLVESGPRSKTYIAYNCTNVTYHDEQLRPARLNPEQFILAMRNRLL